MSGARIVRIAGAVVEARPMGAAVYEVARVGDARIPAEVVRVRGDTATLQVYEDTAGLRLGEPVVATGAPLTVELGPGLLGSVLDGMGRPLEALEREAGSFLPRGAAPPTLDRQKRWLFQPTRSAGDPVSGGDEIGQVQESPSVLHRIPVPPGTSGRVARLDAGEARIDDAVGELEDGTPLRLWHPWPVRTPRPIRGRLPLVRPLLTGQRIFDFLFPVAEGGTVALPGGFGTGKTVIEQCLARYAAADLVVFVGCGERGNEMAEVLEELPRLVDPRSGRPLMERTVLVVNTSNMPVMAREASVYLGLSIAEYYRDMGLRVAVLVDSLSRWAEALRDIGARLQEMPGEEGYPTSVGSRLARAYERAGRAESLGSPPRQGAVTLVGAVSPPGGDFSEPITQAALRVAGALWALDAALAHQRQFPAVDWASSYSLYLDATDAYFRSAGGASWPQLRTRLLDLMQRESELREIAGLLGADALHDSDRLVLEVASLARSELLGQNAYDPNDAFSPVEKTFALASLIASLESAGRSALERGVPLDALNLPAARRAVAAVRAASAGEFERAATGARRLMDAIDSAGRGP